MPADHLFYINGLVVAAVLSLLAAVYTGLFVANRWPRRDRFTVIPAVLGAANVCAFAYLAGIGVVRLGYYRDDLTWVPEAYTILLFAGLLCTALLIVGYAMLLGRWPLPRWLRLTLIAGLVAGFVSLAIPGEFGARGGGAIVIGNGIIRLEYGTLAPVFFAVLIGCFLILAWLVTLALQQGLQHGRLVWLIQGLGLLAGLLAPAVDMLREYDIALFPFPISWAGFMFLNLGALALLVAQYSRALDELEAGRQAIQRLNRDLSRDRLTGLYNRAGMEELLVQRLQQGQRGLLLLVDLDNFKAVNDQKGHLAGDRLLQGAARAVTASLGEADAAARWGGDEFLVLLATEAEDEARQVARAMIDRLRRLPEVDWEVEASIGLTWLTSGTDVQDLVDTADGALYRAKGAGGGRLGGAHLGEPVTL